MKSGPQEERAQEAELLYFAGKNSQHPKDRLIIVGPYKKNAPVDILKYMERGGELSLYELHLIRQYYYTVPALDEVCLAQEVKLWLGRIFHIEIIPTEVWSFSEGEK